MRLDRTRGELPTHGISRVVNSGVLVTIPQVSLALGLRCSTCLTPTPQHLRGDKSGTDCQRRTVSTCFADLETQPQACVLVTDCLRQCKRNCLTNLCSRNIIMRL